MLNIRSTFNILNTQAIHSHHAGRDVHRASLLKGLVPYGTILILIEQYLYRYKERK